MCQKSLLFAVIVLECCLEPVQWGLRNSKAVLLSTINTRASRDVVSSAVFVRTILTVLMENYIKSNIKSAVIQLFFLCVHVSICLSVSLSLNQSIKQSICIRCKIYRHTLNMKQIEIKVTSMKG